MWCQAQSLLFEPLLSSPVFYVQTVSLLPAQRRARTRKGGRRQRSSRELVYAGSTCDCSTHDKMTVNTRVVGGGVCCRILASHHLQFESNTNQTTEEIHDEAGHFCSYDFSPLSFCFKHISCPAQLLMGVRRKADAVLLNHTKWGGRGREIGWQAPHPRCPSFPQYPCAQRNNQIAAAHRIKSAAHRLLINLHLHHSYKIIKDTNNYRVGYSVLKLNIKPQSSLDKCKCNKTLAALCTCII